MGKPVAILGLMMAFVITLLAISQVSDLEDLWDGVTSGPLNTLVNDLTFFVWLLVGAFTIVLVIAVARHFLPDD